MAPTTSQPAKRTRHLRFHPAYLLVLLFMGFFAYTYLQKTAEIKRLSQQEAALVYQNNQTAADNARVQGLISFYQTPQYTEEAARELGYTKQGEILVQSQTVLQPPPQIRAAPPPLPAPAKPIWQQWWDAFSN